MFDKTGIDIAAEHRQPFGYSGDSCTFPSPLGERVPAVSKTRFQHDGRMRGPSGAKKQVAPHQFGRMTYGRAIDDVHVDGQEDAAASHGLTSSPPRGEGDDSASRLLDVRVL